MKKTIWYIAAIALMAWYTGCRNEEKPQGPQVESIKFSESAKSLSVGDITTIGMKVMPGEAKNQGKVEYSVSQPGIVEIKEGSSNDGVIIEAKSRGTVVVTGKIRGFVDYCSITVTGSDERIIPHIISPVSVMEVPLRERRSVTVSLAGGSPLDNSGFTWSYTNQNVIHFESTGSVAVFDTIEPGSAVITVRHPKAQYAVDILVYVLGSGEIPVYITSDSNIIDLKKNAGNYEFQVKLIGGLAEDNGRFVYQLIEGSDYIALHGNGQFGTITPKAAGLALVRISHPKARYPFDIQVIVSEELEYRYIDVNKTLVLLNEGENTVIEARFSGDAPDDVINRYDFSLSEYGIIDVSRSQGLFFINAVKKGKVILSVSNAYADFNREILVVVDNPVEGVVDNQKYIYTNQNVITMEAGGSDSILKMMLVGGNEGDKNSFIWTVDDSSVIEVHTAHGEVRNRSVSRAIYDNMPYEQFEAEALVSAKKTGTAKITLTHPKSKNEAAVLVKVYPKNTFSGVPVVLGGQPYYKVELGKRLEFELASVSGSVNTLGDAQWTINNPKTACVEHTGLSGVITGLSNGITTLTVSGGNLKHSFSAVIIVDYAGELNRQKFIYARDPFMTLTAGQSVTVGILNENMSAEDMKSINYINKNMDIVTLHASGNQMALTALKTGSAEITVKGSETNEIKIVVTVEEPKVNPEQPFYLTTGESIAGVVRGQSADIEVTLVGGSSAKYESSMVWSVENSQIAQLTGSGKKARITGIAEGQTVINVSHVKSANSLRIVLFVAANAGDLNNKVALYVEKNNYLIETGGQISVSLITNANDTQKAGIQWSIDNADIIEYDVSSDRMTVFIIGKTPGIARISVNHHQNIMPQVIYVSVVPRNKGLKYISVPSIMETVAGNNVEIKAAVQNLNYDEIRDISWRVDNEHYVSAAGNGGSCVVQAHANGSAVITVEQKSLGFVKNIIVYVYASYEEMASSYVIGCDQSFYRINRGDVIDVALVFGAKGFPEHEINNIRWSAGNNNTVSVTGNGKKASVKALNTGIAYVYAESGAARNNKVTIEIEVVETIGVNGGYRFEIAAQDRIKGVVTGKFADVLVKIFNGTSEVFSGLNKIQFEAENTDVIGLTVIDNNARVTAKKNGQSYITISHPQVAGSERILVYTASSQYDLDNMYPLFFEKSNYLLKKGDNVRIQARTMDNDEARLSRIRFEVEGQGVISVSAVSKKEINVSALEKGNDVIIVRYDNAVVQRIYVSVTLTVDSDLSTYLVTENIIGMVVGDTRTARVNTNLAEYLWGTLWWVSEDLNIVTVESSNGVRVDLKARGVGKTYVTVRTGNIERKILVFVCADEQESRNYQALNIDQRSFVMNKGQSMPLNIFSYQGTAQGVTQYGDYYNSGGNFGGVIELSNKTAGGVTVNAHREGVAGIRITNAQYNFDIVVYIEVWDIAGGSVNAITPENYITAAQTLYVIEPGERNVTIKVDVIGGNFIQEGYFVWEGYDRSVIDVQAKGSEAVVNPLKNGQTVITIRNLYCENTLPVTVIVGNRYTVENTGEPYFYTEKTVYEMNLNDPSSVIYYELRNGAAHPSQNFRYRAGGDSVSVNTGNPGRLTVTPQRTGMTTLTIYADDSVSINFYFIVREHDLLGTIYLTTDSNFVIGSVNEIKAVDIRLIGYNEVDSNQFKWSIDKKQVAQIVGNGNRGQIYPAAEGDAVITVTHYKAKYPLTINLRITRNTVANELVYLTTQTNVIEALVGEENYIYVQKKGGREDLRDCTWTVDNPAIVSVSGNEYTGIFRIKKAGVARVSVTNAEAAYPLQIVVVAKENSGSPLYITASETLLEMVPGETQKRVSVSLAGGSQADNNRFNWSVYYQNPADPKIAMGNGNVVTLTASGDQCNITSVNEGVARIRVSHEKADNPLYITVRVSKYQRIEFPYNQKQMMTGESEFIAINIPNYENFRDKIIYTSDNSEVCTMIGKGPTAVLTAHGKGYAIIKAIIEGKDQEAALYVNVVEEENPDTSRIVTGKTSYSFHPRSNPVPITARVIGTNMIDSENDHIWWELRNLDGLKEPVVDIYPAQAMNKERGSREIQISPRREGEAQIVIGHRYVDPKYYKTISILVSEVSNALTLDKSLVELKLGHTGMLKAAILGAKAKDYEDIQWLVDTKLMFDGSRQEVVRVMGDGQNVMLYPMADGTVDVTVRYKGLFAVCTVKVESASMFSVQARSVRLYPGGTADIGFDVRPIDSYILWYSSDYGSTDPIIRYDELLGQKTLRITGLREGSAQIQGISNGKHTAINVTVNYDYRVLADAYVEFTPVDSHTNKPTIIRYSVYPPNTRIQADIPANIINDVTVEITPPVHVSDQEPAEGVIYITAKKEVNQTEITWRQIKPDGKLTEKYAKTRISVNFEPREKIIPYFVRYDGVWSNALLTGSGSVEKATPRPAYVGYNKQVLGETIKTQGNAYELEIGDGENHYIAFDRMYQNSYLEMSVDTPNRPLPEGLFLEKVDIVHNGNMTKAIRISGGPDKIEYNRVGFRKRLYVDVKTQWGKGTGGGDIVRISPVWHDEVVVQYQTGWDTVYYPLWNDHEDYVYEIRDVYLYSAAQVNRIKTYLPSAVFTKLTDIQNIKIDEAPPGYDYASNQFEYNFIDDNNYEGVEAGFFYKLFFYGKGYYYSAGAIAAYPQLFSNVTFVNALNVANPAVTRVSLTPVQKSEQVKHNEYKTIYVYGDIDKNDCYNAQGVNVGKFAYYENDNLLDNYGNKEYVKEQLSNLFCMEDELGETEYYKNNYSFNKYYIEELVLTPSDTEDISTWDVFNADSDSKWTRGWKIDPEIKYDWFQDGDKEVWWKLKSLQFFYTGLKRGNAYCVNVYTPPSPQFGQSGPPPGWVPPQTQYIKTVAKSDRGEVREVNFYGDTVGYSQKTGWGSHIGYNYYPYVSGNKNQLNIFGNKEGDYGDFYAQQTKYWSTSKSGGFAGFGEHTSYYARLFNGETGARQRYRWQGIGNPETDDPVIIPIKRMAKFPFFVEDVSGGNYPEIKKRADKGQIVDFKTGPGSAPMPSINTASDNFNSVTVQVRYRLFGDTSDRSMTFNITYKTRNCHHLYNGALGYEKNNIDNIINGNEQLEPQSETNWSKLKPKGDKGDDRFIYIEK